MSEIAFIAATNALVGAGVVLLVTGRLSKRRRRAIRWILGGIGLLYLDVWQRNITALEDSSLREDASDGPDTKPRS